jgi:hypothetical protein
MGPPEAHARSSDCPTGASRAVQREVSGKRVQGPSSLRDLSCDELGTDPGATGSTPEDPLESDHHPTKTLE